MLNLKKNMTVFCDDAFKIAGEKLCEYLKIFYGIEAVKIENDADISIIKKEIIEENYTLSVSDNAKIYAGEIKGAIYGVSTLLQSVDRETLTVAECEICDAPYKPYRGMHLYLPARENIETYKKILETMAFFKMNTVIIEVSGGMEYEKHPEVNEKWEWFCNFSDFVFPGEGRSRSVQWSDTYWKDSIHTEHAGASYLTKAEVRDIVTFHIAII